MKRNKQLIIILRERYEKLIYDCCDILQLLFDRRQDICNSTESSNTIELSNYKYITRWFDNKHFNIKQGKTMNELEPFMTIFYTQLELVKKDPLYSNLTLKEQSTVAYSQMNEILQGMIIGMNHQNNKLREN